MTFDEMRALFPSATQCIHLNHAGTSPIARPVAHAVQTVLGELMSSDSFQAYTNHQKRQETLRAALGRMLGVAPTTLGFGRNTSHGLAIAAAAIPFRPGENVVVPAIEYPANVYPWMAQAHRGVETRLVPPRHDNRVAHDDLMAACNPDTRVLAVSWVQWGTGQRLDLAALGSFCRERDILFVVDIIQGLGALRLDLARLPVDIAAAGCHKWLLAPGGMGILYVHPDVFPRLLPVNIGWNSVVDSIDWERIHFDLRPDPQRFEEGTPNLLGTAALDASVALLEQVGFANVEARVLALADRARAGAAQRGYHLASSDTPEQCSGIVSFRHPTRTNEDVLAILSARKIVAAVRGGNLRFAPHAYNDPADIDRAVDELP